MSHACVYVHTIFCPVVILFLFIVSILHTSVTLTFTVHLPKYEPSASAGHIDLTSDNIVPKFQNKSPV